MFNSISGEQLIDLISADLNNVTIRKVTFDSCSNKTEYVRIYFTYCNDTIKYPFVEIIDNGIISLDRGSMTDDFHCDDELDVFVALKAVAIKAQDFIDDNPHVLRKFYNRHDVLKECNKHGYWFIQNKDIRSFDKWHLYVCNILISHHYSLADLVNTITDQLFENQIDNVSFLKT